MLITCAYEKCEKGQNGARKVFDSKRDHTRFCSAYCRVMAWQQKVHEGNLEEQAFIARISGALRRLDWSHPFVVECRKAIEAGKSRERKRRKEQQANAVRARR